MELFFGPYDPDDPKPHALLKHAVREIWGLDEVPTVARGERGKPWFPDHPDLHFNITHSGRVIACALDRAPVGIDIEMIRPHHGRLPERICSAREYAWLNGQPDRDVAVLKLWTRKEARVKQDGRGLTTPLREIRVPLTDDDTIFEGLYFRSLSGPGWVSAVCGTTAPGIPHVLMPY